MMWINSYVFLLVWTAVSSVPICRDKPSHDLQSSNLLQSSATRDKTSENRHPSLMHVLKFSNRLTSDTSMETAASSELETADSSELETAMMKLAIEVVSNKAVLPPAVLDALDGISVAMQQVLDSANITRWQQQQDVDRMKNDISACDNLTKGLGDIAIAVAGKESEHTECRVQQSIKIDAKTVDCTPFEQAVKYPNAPACLGTFLGSLTPADSSAMFDCLNKIQAWHTTYNATLTLTKSKCDVAQDMLTRQIDVCSGKQGDYESYFCAYYQEVSSKCVSYSTCRENTISARSTVHASVSLAERANKAATTSALKIQCFLGVLKSSNATDQQSLLSGCLNSSISNPLSDIFYYDIPPALPCDTSVVATKPCDSQWEPDRYISKPWYAKAPTSNCTQCAVWKTRAAAPTPSPSPAMMKLGLANCGDIIVDGKKYFPCYCYANDGINYPPAAAEIAIACGNATDIIMGGKKCNDKPGDFVQINVGPLKRRFGDYVVDVKPHAQNDAGAQMSTNIDFDVAGKYKWVNQVAWPDTNLVDTMRLILPRPQPTGDAFMWWVFSNPGMKTGGYKPGPEQDNLGLSLNGSMQGSCLGDEYYIWSNWVAPRVPTPAPPTPLPTPAPIRLERCAGITVDGSKYSPCYCFANDGKTYPPSAAETAAACGDSMDIIMGGRKCAEKPGDYVQFNIGPLKRKFAEYVTDLQPHATYDKGTQRSTNVDFDVAGKYTWQNVAAWPDTALVDQMMLKLGPWDDTLEKLMWWVYSNPELKTGGYKPGIEGGNLGLALNATEQSSCVGDEYYIWMKTV